MAQDDFGEGFQAYLRERSTEEIKFDLTANKIVDPEQRALAVIEIERRRKDSELSQVKADLADCQKRLRRQKWVIYTAAVGVMVAAASAIAAWLEQINTALDIYRAANLLIKQHEQDAARHAAMRADTLLEGGDMEGRRVWLSILEAIKELQRTRPRRDEPTH